MLLLLSAVVITSSIFLFSSVVVDTMLVLFAARLRRLLSALLWLSSYFIISLFVLQWGAFFAVAGGVAYAFSPLYRGLTVQFKTCVSTSMQPRICISSQTRLL